MDASFWLRVTLALGLLAGSSAIAQDAAPTSLLDPRLDALKRASVVWEERKGPTRAVVDQVVIVPDLPSYFEAISAWDRESWFPILIDDLELVPRFLRKFRPRRVVRYATKEPKIPEPRIWEEASRAVDQSWLNPGELTQNTTSAQGRVLPSVLGSTIPGVVVSTPESESLAGAVALAAGRFQPLIRWHTDRKPQDKLTMQEALELAHQLEQAVAEVTPRYASLGDDCDFLTLAADYPVRYHLAGKVFREGDASFDDLIGRDFATWQRWSYAGRLEGNHAQSVYRAMCSLFLQPDSALLFDTYDRNSPDFRPYDMSAGRTSLPADYRVDAVSHPGANLAAWYGALSGFNRFGLVYINSRGAPTAFGLDSGDEGLSPDIPPSAPALVLMNHSFSAAYPHDPRTIAGSWLLGGAYLYFGSLNEPYVQAFRTPQMVLSLLKDRIPIAAAVRMLPEEHPAFGAPWRLHLLGDPLYRIDPRLQGKPRVAPAASNSLGVACQESPVPPATAKDTDRLAWAVSSTLMDAAANRRRDSVELAILKIRRETLPEPSRGTLDGLLLDLWSLGTPRGQQAVARLLTIPAKDRSPRVKDAIVRNRVATLQGQLEKGAWPQAWKAWEELLMSDADLAVKKGITTRVGRASNKAGKVSLWKARLDRGVKASGSSEAAACCREELARLQKQ